MLYGLDWLFSDGVIVIVEMICIRNRDTARVSQPHEPGSCVGGIFADRDDNLHFASGHVIVCMMLEVKCICCDERNRLSNLYSLSQELFPTSLPVKYGIGSKLPLSRRDLA